MEGETQKIPLSLIAVWLALAVYVFAFAWFYPQALTIADETAYMRQANAFAQGRANVLREDLFTGEIREEIPSDYPPGTSLVMAPLMALGGWRAGFLLGALTLEFSVLLLAYWLSREGRSPLFALLVLAYPPVLVIARCGMSDLPTLALVTAGLYCFFRGGVWRLGAGFLAGMSLLFRETAPLLFVFFFAGALLRRERGSLWLIAGVALGAALRPLAAWLVFGDPLFVKQTHPGFSFAAVPANLPLYAGATLIFMPGGLLFAALYRGPRRVELLLTLAAFLLLHLFYNYSAEASGAKQWVLVPRFLIPLLPIFILAMSESVPRLFEAMRQRAGEALRWVRPVAGVLLALCVCAESWLVNWKHAQWSAEQRHATVAIYSSTPDGAAILTNLEATSKHVNELYDGEFAPRVVADFGTAGNAQIAAALERRGTLHMVLLFRSDSESWREKNAAYETRIEALKAHFHVQEEHRTPVSETGELRFYRIER